MSPIETIQKLLALAAGGTEHEAALAAEKANELALKYNIDLIKLQHPISDTTSETYDEKAQQWISNIISGVSLVNAVKHFRSPALNSFRYRLVGKKHNIQITISITEYLVREVKRLNTAQCKSHFHLDNSSERAAYRKAFRLGASQRLYRRLREQYNSLRTQDTSALRITGSNALVVANYFDTAMKEADAFLKSEGTTIVTHKSRSISIKSHEGWQDGQRAGDSINLSPQLERKYAQPIR